MSQRGFHLTDATVGTYDKASAAGLIVGSGADLVSFAKPFISNSDLGRRFERDLPLTPPVVGTFYQGRLEG
jgi:N-ethylmaleimide reductase